MAVNSNATPMGDEFRAQLFDSGMYLVIGSTDLLNTMKVNHHES